MVNSPKITAVFSTYNRADFLECALLSLTKQTIGVDEFDVVVLNDGSSDHTAEVVESYKSKLNITYVYQENMGLASGKNACLKHVNAPIVLFMDDDDVATTSLLEEHLLLHKEFPDENYAVLGFTSIDGEIIKAPIMNYVTEVGCYLFCYPRLSNRQILDYTFFWGGRSSCKMSLLRTENFDPIFKFGCEDIELGYRLSKLSPLKVIYNKNAETIMMRGIDILSFLNRSYKQGRSNYLFHKKHPVSEVEAWANLVNFQARWESLKHKYDSFVASAVNLDRLAQARIECGLPLDEDTIDMLHQSYSNAIQIEFLRGSYEAMLEEKRISFEI